MATSGSDTEKFISLVVKCVATGRRHDDRDVCTVVVVDQSEKVLLKKNVKPEKPVVSYLTPLTGAHAGDLDSAPDLASVITEVKGLLGPNAVLVGQNVKSDIEWLKLEEGVDYQRTVELSEMFKAYNPRYGNVSYFGLAHEANTLVQAGFITEQHCDPVTDAKAAMKLFNRYHGNPSLIEEAKRKLLSSRPAMSFVKSQNYKYEGVCMAAFVPKKCSCGALTLRSEPLQPECTQ